ncbi:MAG: sulfur carrier protein ThiS [Pseudobdellovibrionaceae bacterium]
MLELVLNGQKIQFETPLTLQQLLETKGYKKGEVAVAVDQIFVPRSQYDDFILRSEQKIEILSPMQGG